MGNYASTSDISSLLDAKGALIKKALGVDDIRIEIDEEKVSFPWFSELPDAETCQAYQNFIGTVMGVDDTASIMVAWDNGSGLNVVYGEDSCRKLDSVKVTCYGSTETWDSRKDAMEFYLRAMASSEGSEQSRYTKVYTELAMGLPDCTDEE